MNQITILITGGNGQLARALTLEAKKNQYSVHVFSHQAFDLLNNASMEHVLTRYCPSIVINTAAYTQVDLAETDRSLCEDVNHHGVHNLSVLCARFNILLIHLSTDYVFNGESLTPYREYDQPIPLNWYGHTKYLGEQAIQRITEKYIILRVSAVYSEFGHNFLRTMLNLFEQKEVVRVVDDQIICPTSATEIASALFSIIYTENKTWGVFHFSNSAVMSWYEFANKIFNSVRSITSLKVRKLIPIPTSEYPTAAKRPAYSVLNCQKIATHYAVHPLDFLTMLDNTIPLCLMPNSDSA